MTSPEDGATVERVENITVKGHTEPNATVTINGKKVTVKSDGTFLQNVPVKMGENIITVEAKVTGKEPNSKILTITRIESESEYKASCKSISFDELNKNPDKYAGQRIVYSVRVVQIMETDGTTEIRMDVNDVFGDTIYVVYNGTTSAVEDSIITVYGEVYGSYTYESIAGWQITLPRIDAKYIEVH
ncbi:MAG: hypothetical protein QFX38_04395 [Methanothermobacter sp.]|nr:hypothetical protein [Methanothermobacter sp.]